MSIDHTLKPREFKEWLAEASEGFRRQIELEVEAFDTDPAAREERLKKARHKKTGYRFFCETYFPHYLTRPNSKLHEDLFRDLPVMVHKKEGQKELVVAPRGSAKSTHISLLFVIYCVVMELKHYPCIIMDAFEQAAIAIEAIKAELEVNPRLQQDFPDVVGKGRVWREGDIITRNNVKIEGFGTSKKIRGRRHGPYRPDLVVLDDIENDENIESPKQRDKLENWILKAVLELGPPDGSMDVLYGGTIIHHDAVIVRFSRRPDWNVTRYQAIERWPDNMDLWDEAEEIYLNSGEPAAKAFYEQNRAAMDTGVVLNWPGNHTIFWLMIKKRAGKHGAFESEYQNNPINENSGFRTFTWWTVQKRDLVMFGAIDPSLGKKGHRRDPSAILVGGYDRLTGTMDLIEASIRRRLPDVIISDTIDMQRRHNCMLWFVEAVQFQEFLRTTLMKDAAKAGVAISAVPVTPHTDKDLRIERLQVPVAAGQIRFHQSQPTLINQLMQWPNGDHDDGPDALDMLWQHTVQYAGGAGGGQGGGFMTSGPSSSSSAMEGYSL